MDINQRIRNYLLARRTESTTAFASSNPLLNSVYNKLQAIDTNQTKGEMYQELIDNCLNKWSQSTKPINGILFEYDYVLRPNEEACAHGIVFDGFPIQPEPFGMGDGYDFADRFEGVHGVTLSTLNPLTVLAGEADLWDIEGCKELVNSYRFTAFLSLHDALADFVKTTAFGVLNCRLPFHFLINEHDNGDTYPVYIVESCFPQNKLVPVVSSGLDRRRARYQSYSAKFHLESALSSLTLASAKLDNVPTASDLLRLKGKEGYTFATFLYESLRHVHSYLRELFALLAINQPFTDEVINEVRAATAYLTSADVRLAVVKQLDALIAEDLANTPAFEYPKQKALVERLLLGVRSSAESIAFYIRE